MQWLSLLVDIVFPPRSTEICVRTMDDTMPDITPRVFEEAQLEIICLLPYKDPNIHALIVEAKYHRNQRAWDILGGVFGDYIREYLGEHRYFETHPPVCVPIPLSRKRRSERGYNQTEEIVRRAFQDNADMVVDTKLLARTRDTRAQTKLSAKEREENLRDAFLVTRPLDPRATYVLVDDVYTTGATIRSAAKALKAAGAREVSAITLAH